ncbi:MAG: type II toxin-antitoxin system VapC family toxin [Acidobacteria bacterium]|nr:type II toxin-antitoxin system VapC family toxin [Acidobacteriota bacterium]
MTLVDTSVWVDHLRRGVPRLVALLEEGRVCCHPFVVGELACGQLGRRDHVLQLLGTLPQAPAASQDEALRLLRTHSLHGQGLGWIDVHLLASALLGRCALWTRDKRLAAAAVRVGMTDN